MESVKDAINRLGLIITKVEGGIHLRNPRVVTMMMHMFTPTGSINYAIPGLPTHRLSIQSSIYNTLYGTSPQSM
jgi:hypothetical protein